MLLKPRICLAKRLTFPFLMAKILYSPIYFLQLQFCIYLQYLIFPLPYLRIKLKHFLPAQFLTCLPPMNIILAPSILPFQILVTLILESIEVVIASKRIELIQVTCVICSYQCSYGYLDSSLQAY